MVVLAALNQCLDAQNLRALRCCITIANAAIEACFRVKLDGKQQSLFKKDE
jgi:hypothetical protein